ncbi:MAG: glycosyltransferase [Anaerolineae bacterium]|nr:glycosyltransferase [Anaerolineae bacterium]
MTLPDALPHLVVVNAFYKPAFVYGGPVRSLAALCEEIAASRVPLKVLTTDAGGTSRLDLPLNVPLNVDGVEVIYTPLGQPSLGSFFYAPALIPIFAALVPSLTVAHLEVLWTHAAYPLMRLCQRAGLPYTTSLRGQLLPYALHRSRLRKRLYLSLVGWRFLNGAAAIHCTDPGEAAAARALRLHPPLVVVPNGIDLTPFRNLPPREQGRSRWHIPAEAPLILFSGRLHPKKRPQIALEVLSGLKNAHLIVAGADELGMALALQAQAKQQGCEDRFHWVGLLEQKALIEAMSAADLLIMPSEADSENFGMAAAEALAAGLPLLTSAGIPVGEAARQAGAGLTVTGGSPAFLEGARTLLADRALLRAMGERGRVLAFARYDSQRTAQEMLQMWRVVQKRI